MDYENKYLRQYTLKDATTFARNHGVLGLKRVHLSERYISFYSMCKKKGYLNDICGPSGRKQSVPKGFWSNMNYEDVEKYIKEKDLVGLNLHEVKHIYHGLIDCLRRKGWLHDFFKPEREQTYRGMSLEEIIASLKDKGIKTTKQLQEYSPYLYKRLSLYGGLNLLNQYKRGKK